MTTRDAVGRELELVVEVPFWQRWLRALASFARSKPLGAISGIILLAMVFIAVFASVIAPYAPNLNNTADALVGPSARHLFGTDQFGRDILSRVIHGARISLYVGLGATLIGTGVATFLGVITAYFGSFLDYFVQRVVDAVQAIPPLVLLIGILVVLGPSITNVIIALSVRQAFVSSRVIRASVLSVMANPYVEVARVIGASHARTMFFHILPNVLATVIVLATVSIGGNVIAEASLSFLGYGVPPPSPTWGGMMSAEGRAYMLAAPWILIAPTVALSLLVFAMNMFGDALRDKLDPRLRGGGSVGARGS